MNLKEILNGPNKIKKLTPELYDDTINISIPFFVLHKKIYEKGEELLTNKYKINQTQLDVLVTLFYFGEDDFTLTPTNLYEKLVFSSGGMTKILKKLEEKNLIRRVENKEDKRSKLVQLTEEGKSLASESFKEILEIEASYYNKLEKKEQIIFEKLLKKML